MLFECPTAFCKHVELPALVLVCTAVLYFCKHEKMNADFFSFLLSFCTGDVGEYQVPYQNCVPNDPSIEDMKKVVVTQEIRPDINERWNSNEVIL